MSSTDVLRCTLVAALAGFVVVLSFGTAWLVDDPTSAADSGSARLVGAVREFYADGRGGTLAEARLLPGRNWQMLRAFGPGTPRWQVREALNRSGQLPELVPPDETLLAFSGRLELTTVEVPTSELVVRCLPSPAGLPRATRFHVVLGSGGSLSLVPAAFEIGGHGICVRIPGTGS